MIHDTAVVKAPIILYYHIMYRDAYRDWALSLLYAVPKGGEGSFTEQILAAQ
jgi:hypothetical protein